LTDEYDSELVGILKSLYNISSWVKMERKKSIKIERCLAVVLIIPMLRKLIKNIINIR